MVCAHAAVFLNFWPLDPLEACIPAITPHKRKEKNQMHLLVADEAVLKRGCWVFGGAKGRRRRRLGARARLPASVGARRPVPRSIPSVGRSVRRRYMASPRSPARRWGGAAARGARARRDFCSLESAGRGGARPSRTRTGRFTEREEQCRHTGAVRRGRESRQNRACGENARRFLGSFCLRARVCTQKERERACVFWGNKRRRRRRRARARASAQAPRTRGLALFFFCACVKNQIKEARAIIIVVIA